MSDLRIVFTTIASMEQAERLARALIDAHLAACVNIIPGIRSFYSWQGELHDDPEFLLLIKTSANNLPKLEQSFESLHPYETPEFVVVEPGQVSDRYLSWALKAVEKGST